MNSNKDRKDNNEKNGSDEAKAKIIYEKILSAAKTAVAIPLTTKLMLYLTGFRVTGILGGSLAAKLMSIFAVAYGSGVPAGGLVAILQALGTGLSASVFWVSATIATGQLVFAVAPDVKEKFEKLRDQLVEKYGPNMKKISFTTFNHNDTDKKDESVIRAKL